MAKCIDCLRLEAERAKEKERIKRLEGALEEINNRAINVAATEVYGEEAAVYSVQLHKIAEAALARETDNEILLRRQKEACGGI